MACAAIKNEKENDKRWNSSFNKVVTALSVNKCVNICVQVLQTV